MNLQSIRIKSSTETCWNARNGYVSCSEYVDKTMNGSKKDYKLVIIGASHVGKTTLLKKFIGKTELGRDAFVQKSIERQGQLVDLKIHDTMGQERFRSLTSSYYRGSDGCLVCFDVMNQSTFDELENWITDLKDSSGPKRISVLLVGLNSRNYPTQKNASENNTNSYPSQKVDQSKIDLFCEEHKLPTYVEVDLTNNTAVVGCFETIVDIMIEDILNSQQHKQHPEINKNLIHIGKPNSTRQEDKRGCGCSLI